MTGRMPFGKYKGWALVELPDMYLSWLATIDLREPLSSAVQAELNRRETRYHETRYRETRWRRGDEERWHGETRWRRADDSPGPAPAGLVIRPDEVDLARRVWDLGYRALAQKLHPDHGGSGDEMRRLNLLAERIREALVEGAV